MRKLAVCVFLFCSPVLAAPAPPALVDMIPPQSLGAAVIQRGALAWVRAWIDARPEMRAELGEFLGRTLGVDLTRIDGAAFWISQTAGPKPMLGAFVRMSGHPAPKGKSLGQHQGVELVANGGTVLAAVPGGLIAGSEPEVRAGIDAS